MKIHADHGLFPIFASLAVFVGLGTVFAIGRLVGRVDWIDSVGPAILAISLAMAAYETVRRNPRTVWTPVPWFMAASAAYFGFGPLVYHFGSDESIEFMNSFYTASEDELARTNILNVVGIGMVLAAFLIFQSLLKFRNIQPFGRLRDVEMRRLALLFVVVGVADQLVFVLPHRLGLLDFTLPGAVLFLADLSRAAIVLLFILADQKRRGYQALLVGLIVFELTLAFMSFSKLEIIEVLIAVGLGWYLVRPDIRGLLVGAAVIVALYVFVLSPFVAFGRIAYGAFGVESTREIAQAAEEFGRTDRDDIASLVAGAQGWWTRFSYTNAQSFAMKEYDRGAAGETLNLVWYAFVPRLLVPDKPIMTPGREFTSLVLGYESNTHSAPGIFGEAYWNGGWLMVLLVSAYVGFVFAGFVKFADQVIGNGQLEYLPVLFIGIAMGHSPDSWFAATYVGSVAQAVGLFVLMYIVSVTIVRRRG